MTAHPQAALDSPVKTPLNTDPEHFFVQWNAELEQVAHILHYLHTYPSLLENLELQDLIRPDELLQKQRDWLHLQAQYTGIESDFFKPCWVPLQRDSYSCFLDLSDAKYPVFESSYFAVQPYAYTKLVLVNGIADLMLLIDDKEAVAALHQKRLDAPLADYRQRLVKRNHLVYSGKMPIEKPQRSEIEEENKSLEVRKDEDSGEVICKNISAIIAGLLPFEIEIETSELIYLVEKFDLDFHDFSRIKTIRDLTHFIRVVGISSPQRFRLRMPSVGATAYYTSGNFYLSGNCRVVEEFEKVLAGILKT